MQVSFNIINNATISFGNKQSYSLGYNHGKIDGLNGSRSFPKNDEQEHLDKTDYDNGYNNGYKMGKACRTEKKSL